jgi:hypothetical protein
MARLELRRIAVAEVDEVRMNTKRAGFAFALVGPHFIVS